MYLHSTRGCFTPQNTDLVFPISPQFESELIALARRCITLCLPARVAFAFPAAPVLHFHCFSFYFDRARIARPCVSLPIEPVCSPASRIICVPTAYVSAARTCALALVQYSTFRFRCRCHVTQTRWSRAFAPSSWVAQDT